MRWFVNCLQLISIVSTSLHSVSSVMCSVTRGQPKLCQMCSAEYDNRMIETCHNNTLLRRREIMVTSEGRAFAHYDCDWNMCNKDVFRGFHTWVEKVAKLTQKEPLECLCHEDAELRTCTFDRTCHPKNRLCVSTQSNTYKKALYVCSKKTTPLIYDFKESRFSRTLICQFPLCNNLDQAVWPHSTEKLDYKSIGDILFTRTRRKIRAEKSRRRSASRENTGTEKDTANIRQKRGVKEGSSKKTANTGLWVGLGVGFGMFVFGVIVAVLVFCCMKRRKETKPNKQPIGKTTPKGRKKKQSPSSSVTRESPETEWTTGSTPTPPTPTIPVQTAGKTLQTRGATMDPNTGETETEVGPSTLAQPTKDLGITGFATDTLIGPSTLLGDTSKGFGLTGLLDSSTNSGSPNSLSPAKKL